MEHYCPQCNQNIDVDPNTVNCPTCNTPLQAVLGGMEGMENELPPLTSNDASIDIDLDNTADTIQQDVTGDGGSGMDIDFSDQEESTENANLGLDIDTSDQEATADNASAGLDVDFNDDQEPPHEDGHANSEEDHAAQETTTNDTSTDMDVDFNDDQDETSQSLSGETTEQSLPTEDNELPAHLNPPNNEHAIDDSGDDTGDDSSDTSSDQQPAETPAHLSLPTFDFGSMASFSGSESGSTPAATSTDTSSQTAPSGEGTPAHLNLPNFPEFSMPGIPGLQDDQQPDFGSDADISDPDQSQQDLASQQEEPVPEDSDSNTPAHLAPPPPPPKPVTQIKPIIPEEKTEPEKPKSIADQLGLPQIQTVSAPERTHVKKVEDDDLNAKELKEGSKSIIPVFIIIFLAVIGIAGVIGEFATPYGWFFNKFFFKPESQLMENRTPRDRAIMALKRGITVYQSGSAKRAITYFKQAIDFDPTFAKAHRSLAIAYAKSEQKILAVQEYRKYLELAPNAEDKEEVQKILDEFDKKKETAAPPEKKRKKRKKRRR